MKKPTHRLLGELAVFASAFCFYFSTVVIRWSQAEVTIDPSYFAFFRFLTGFLVFHVSPELGEGFMHMSEGWAMFVIAFLVLGGMAWVLVQLEGAVRRRFA